VGAGLTLFAAGCGGATPEAAFKDFQAAIKAKDADKLWNVMSKDAQTKAERTASSISEQLKMLDKLPPEQRKLAEEKMAEALGVTAADLKTLDGKKLFSISLKNPKTEEALKNVASATLENVKVEGDKATGTVKTGTKSDTLHFVKEGGSWKLGDFGERQGGR
jgi:hypothetical protein